MKTLIAAVVVLTLSGCSVWQDLNTYAMNNSSPGTSYVLTPNGGLYTVRGVGSGMTTINYSPPLGSYRGR